MRAIRFTSVLFAGVLAWTLAARAATVQTELEPPAGPARATIDLATRDGVAQVQGQWRYSDTKIIEIDFIGPGPDGQPTGRPVKTYDVTPHAQNVLAEIRGGQKRPFTFSTIGQLAAIGRRTGVANILGFNFSGFIAWWLWRTIYLSKLPRMEKKLRVALDWTLDLIFSKDLVQFMPVRAPAAARSESPAGVPEGVAVSHDNGLRSAV